MYIPTWVLPQEDLDNLMAAGAGATPYIIYAPGVPADPTTDPDSFDRKDCSLVLFEIDFGSDLGCHDKITVKTDKYYPLSLRPPTLLGTRRARLHSHRPRRHHPLSPGNYV